MDNNLEKDAGSHPASLLRETDWTDYWIRFN